MGRLRQQSIKTIPISQILLEQGLFYITILQHNLFQRNSQLQVQIRQTHSAGDYSMIKTTQSTIPTPPTSSGIENNKHYTIKLISTD